MSSAVTRAPMKAKGPLTSMAVGKKTMESMTANPAPELTPMVLGEARALFMTFCRMRPELDKPRPAPRQARVRGMRICQMSVYSVPSRMRPDRTPRRSGRLMGTLPRAMEARQAQRSIRKSRKKTGVSLNVCAFPALIRYLCQL